MILCTYCTHLQLGHSMEENTPRHVSIIDNTKSNRHNLKNNTKIDEQVGNHAQISPDVKRTAIKTNNVSWQMICRSSLSSAADAKRVVEQAVIARMGTKVIKPFMLEARARKEYKFVAQRTHTCSMRTHSRQYSMHAHVADESRAKEAADQQGVPTRAAATDTQWGRRCQNFNEQAINSIIGRDDGE